MYIVGITGGIGTGKTIVAEIFSAMGYPVYNSDVEAKCIMQTDPVVMEELRSQFGSRVFVNGQIDRQCLANEVFTNPDRLAILNSIVHPAVRVHFNEWRQKQHSDIVFLETAILFESGFNREANRVLLIQSPEELRIKRVMLRDQCTREQVVDRMARQWSQEQKAMLADFVINNDEIQPLLPQIEQLLAQINKSV